MGGAGREGGGQKQAIMCCLSCVPAVHMYRCSLCCVLGFYYTSVLLFSFVLLSCCVALLVKVVRVGEGAVGRAVLTGRRSGEGGKVSGFV